MDYIKFKMQKIFWLTIALIGLSQANLVPNYPDAIRCGADTSYNRNSIFFLHAVDSVSISSYCQIISIDHRCVLFNADGSYRAGTGQYDSRRGCENKNLSTLEKQGRTFILEDSALKAKVTKLQQEIQLLKNMKESWKKECKSELLAEIKNNGLQIGSRWRIRQETTYFVIRDVQGTKSRDSRVAFPAGSYLNPR